MKPLPFRLDYSAHGGRTCGRSHLFSFHTGRWARSTRVRIIKDGIEQAINANYSPHYGCREKFSHCIEVCLTDFQAKQWEQPLFDCGFKLVYQFKNSKTGNNVRVYLLTTGGERG